MLESESPPAVTRSKIKTSRNTQSCHFHSARLCSLLSQFMLLAICFYSRSCYPAVPFSLSDAVYPLHCSFGTLNLVPVSCFTSHHPATLFWIRHTTTPLDSTPNLLTLSQFRSLQPQPPHLVSYIPPELPLACTPSLPVLH